MDQRLQCPKSWSNYHDQQMQADDAMDISQNKELIKKTCFFKIGNRTIKISNLSICELSLFRWMQSHSPINPKPLLSLIRTTTKQKLPSQNKIKNTLIVVSFEPENNTAPSNIVSKVITSDSCSNYYFFPEQLSIRSKEINNKYLRIMLGKVLLQ